MRKTVDIRTFRRSMAVSALLPALVLAACDDDPAAPSDENEQELITDVTIRLTPVGGGASIESTITDPDGLGPQAPLAQSAAIALDPGVTYNGEIEFLDNQDPLNPEDITEEVEEEDDEHRVFYIISGLNGVEVPDTSLDTDGNGFPLGLTYQVVVDAGASGSGSIRVVLSHYDDNNKGDGSTQSNETDVDVSFDVSVN